MMKKLLLSTALGSMLLAGGVAVAAPHMGMGHHGARGAMMGDTNGDGNITKAELTSAINAHFAKMDPNGDGQVTQAERDAMRQAKMDDRFNAMDADKNGQISKAEMAASREARQEKRKEWRETRKADRADGERGPGMGKHMRGHHGGGMGGRGMMDANKDGTITKAEFSAPMIAMFDRADSNKDGTVTKAEHDAARQAMRAEMKAKWEARKASAQK